MYEALAVEEVALHGREADVQAPDFKQRDAVCGCGHGRLLSDGAALKQAVPRPPDVVNRGAFREAVGLGQRAAGREGAAGPDVPDGRDHAGDFLERRAPLASVAAEVRDAGDEPLRVGVARIEDMNVITEEVRYSTIKEKDSGPSCSLAEALQKQDLFINSMLAQTGCDILWRMLREGRTFYREPISISIHYG